MKITGPDQAKLRKAILNEFDNLEFQQFLNDRLDLKLNNIAITQANFEIQLGDAIRWLDYRSRVPELVSSLLAERSDVAAFQKLAFDFGRMPSVYTASPDTELTKNALESLINAGQLDDVNVFIRRITDSKRCVCRVKVTDQQGKARYGTGFLVGDDLLLSNYHVFEPVINNPELSSQVVCKFDYELDGGGNTISPGNDYGLDANEPILASSPPCQFDVEGTPDVNVDWPADSLDYALVKLADQVGSLAYGPNADKITSAKATVRGWIKPGVGTPALFKGSNIIIIQHPDKAAMKIAIGPGMIQGCDDKGMRVRYTLNTMEGSSGSPCFDGDFNWIALHNMGDPNYGAKYNQGIPAARIIEDLEKKNINF